MIKGQCLCGSVKYVYNKSLSATILCFCKDCQLAQGTVGGWNSPIESEHFKLQCGANKLKEYFHSKNKARVFCIDCGSPVYSYRVDLPGVMRLRLGSVTSGQIPVPTKEAFVEQKPSFISVNIPK